MPDYHSEVNETTTIVMSSGTSSSHYNMAESSSPFTTGSAGAETWTNILTGDVNLSESSGSYRNFKTLGFSHYYVFLVVLMTAPTTLPSKILLAAYMFLQP